MERQIINYLPPFIREYAEMQSIMSAEQTEIELAWESAEQTLNNQFISTADESGINRYERMLGITPKTNDTLEERRYRLQTLYGKELPYTLAKLKETLTLLCGAEGFSIDVSGYTVTVKLDLASASNYDDVVKVVNKMLPCNMERDVTVLYHKYNEYFGDTYDDLADYTYDYLREGDL